MSKKKKLFPHPYADRQAFERLMPSSPPLLQSQCGLSRIRFAPIRLNPDTTTPLQEVQTCLQKSPARGIELPTPTLQRSGKTQCRYGILDRQMHRWGLLPGISSVSE